MDEKAMNQLYMSLGKDKTENAQILETIIECKHQNKIGFVSPERGYEAPVCCTTVENVI